MCLLTIIFLWCTKTRTRFKDTLLVRCFFHEFNRADWIHYRWYDTMKFWCGTVYSVVSTVNLLWPILWLWVKYVSSQGVRTWRLWSLWLFPSQIIIKFRFRFEWMDALCVSNYLTQSTLVNWCEISQFTITFW